MSQGVVPHDEPQLKIPDLVGWFRPTGRHSHRIGLEVECGLVRPDTGRSVSYDEPAGTRALLVALLDGLGGDPIHEGGALVGLSLPDGAALTLEMAGAIEYSSAPQVSVSESVAAARRRLVEVARVAEPLRLRLLTGAHLPFDDPAGISWAPKERTRIMRRWFAQLGDGGRLGDQVMGLTLSTQVSLDALDEAEYLEKFRMLLGVSPFLAALLANAPALAGPHRDDGLVSRRMAYWRRIDPARCQHLASRLYAVTDLAELVQVLCALPMIYRRSDHGYVPGGPHSFRESLRDGFGDGTRPTIADWRTHLGQVWPSIRPRRTLETRLPDGQAWAQLALVPALFVGLAEEPAVRRAALDVVSEFRTEALDLIAVKAAQGSPDGINPQIREVAGHLVHLAEKGLAARVARGLEHPDIVKSLEPAFHSAATGRPPADAIVARWTNDWAERPDRYVAALGVPTEQTG
ncbi:glutamate-cysteine ligase family protein [Micromonospora sp. WMMD1128]|uniref:glutamate-cysteine ligase family protein n=1 Tax=unclassified Micromonospora TaxID=2617518 RepID=UPI00248BC774|nr:MULTISPECIES: glutamate-cysteine ligase family protein [unclassified Micromonospora]WBB72865.1 glutamate-cysteine ligase family protein [Micromonospora sp. WMMD1128]WFE33688.1 glutamate-cysteine ligase family protein [Micromonospora sp. WMMD975]